MPHSVPLLGYVAVASALCAAVILLGYLIRRPPLDLRTKIRLALGLGLLPTITAAAGTAAGMQTTAERHFCGSCHVMTRHSNDSNRKTSQTLAARHSRNSFFGDRSCYVCHADYGMLGYPMTKLSGLRHVWEYYVGGFRDMPIEEALPKIKLRKPYDNSNCRHCHTGTLAHWSQVPDHVSLEKELSTNRVSCTSGGCHGYAHPFTKPDSERARQDRKHTP
jgi:cytochrome c-type protein NapC